MIPEVNLWSGTDAIDGLLAALARFWESVPHATLDFSRCRFLTADAVAIIASLKLHRDVNGLVTVTDWSTISPALQKQLGKWDVASVLGGENVPWTDNCVPLLHQTNKAHAESVEFVDHWILGRSAMPQMNDALAKVTRKSICEVLGNVFLHAESSIGAIVLGQIYPKRKMFQICVCDSGIGLVRRVQESGRSGFSPVQAIRWSLESGNSTMHGSTPHGLGLFMLREFIKVNGGIFRIYANNGCFNESSGVSRDRVMSSTLPGTLVDFRFNVRDDVTYTLAGT